MARTVRDNQLGNRTVREKLRIRGKPYWRGIEAELSLGYRRLRGKSGTFTARHYAGDGAYAFDVIGTADDRSDADGVTVFSFDQAVAKARELHTKRAEVTAGITGPITVKQAMTDYVKHLDLEGKKTYNTERAIEFYINPALGKYQVAKLTTRQIEQWRGDIAKAPARGKLTNDPDARKASANRVLTILKAGLNDAYKNKMVSSNEAWRNVENFKGVGDRKRERFLSPDESMRLLNACDPDFRQMVVAALHTGCRYEELCVMRVGDFDAKSGTISIPKAKSARSRKVYLTEEGQRLFRDLAVGRARSETMIRRHDGLPFGEGHQKRRIELACERAGIERITFHGLRHTYASQLAMAGVPQAYIRDALGHRTLTMSDRYMHFAPSHFAETIRKAVPSYSLTKSNVTAIR
jgi:integrase